MLMVTKYFVLDRNQICYVWRCSDFAVAMAMMMVIFFGPDYTFLMDLERIIGHSRDLKLEHAGVLNARGHMHGTGNNGTGWLLENLGFRF